MKYAVSVVTVQTGLVECYACGFRYTGMWWPSAILPLKCPRCFRRHAMPMAFLAAGP